jgi:hypothetical protein
MRTWQAHFTLQCPRHRLIQNSQAGFIPSTREVYDEVSSTSPHVPIYMPTTLPPIFK